MTLYESWFKTIKKSIKLAKNAGFCYGVKRAIDGTLDILEDNINVFCLGEIVHNKIVVQDLKEKGVIFIDELSEKNENVIIEQSK